MQKRGEVISMGAGRKGKWETNVEPYLDLVKSMRIDGHTEEQIFTRLGVGHSSWEIYKREHLELMEALKISKEGLVSKLEQTLFQKALEGNPTLLIFALKNLAPKKWADRHEIDAGETTEAMIAAMSRFVNKL